MDLTQVKKELYKQKPIAKFTYIRSGFAYYTTKLDLNQTVIFRIPVEDMGDATFMDEMEGKLLIRWIDAFNNPQL